MAGEEEEEPEKGMKSANGQIYLPAPSDNSSKNKPDLCLPTLPSLPSLPWEPEQEQEEKEFQAVLELLCHSAQRCAGCRQLAMVTETLLNHDDNFPTRIRQSSPH